jgi:hypothetical protein
MNSLYQRKWRKFLKRSWPLRHVPFVDFVFAAGSLATRNLREESDFDVIVGARQGRIFTVRMLCFLLFKPLGLWARHESENHKFYKDKLCFNHFVTPEVYRLSPPHNDYWKKLYLSLVPIFGDKIVIQRFYRANEDWLGKTPLYQEDKRHIYKKSGWLKKSLEWALSGRIGDWLENMFKKIQIKKIKRGVEYQETYKPRIIISDKELEFHPDTRRIEDSLG